jgi:hypothetical protein
LSPQPTVAADDLDGDSNAAGSGGSNPDKEAGDAMDIYSDKDKSDSDSDSDSEEGTRRTQANGKAVAVSVFTTSLAVIHGIYSSFLTEQEARLF